MLKNGEKVKMLLCMAKRYLKVPKTLKPL